MKRNSLVSFLTALLFSIFAVLPNSTVFAEKEYPELSVDPTGQGEGYSAVLYDNTNLSF